MVLDAGFSWLADAASSGAVLLPEAARTVSAEVVQAAPAEPGLFDLVLVKPFELAIETLSGVGIGYGPAIILFTIILKALTFPLNKQQIESTAKMQAIQPAAKELQEKYRNKDPARLNVELQKLYANNQVNPLAGCLPSLAQIPIFIGLYRSVLNLAKEDKLVEGFLWLPSLEGPVSDYTKGTGWLFGNEAQSYAWSDLTPPLGWHDTLAYLALPVLLVLSQYVSMALLTPKTEDPAQQQSQAILKVLPLMIGWFALSVPSGLGLYWITNNVITTASTLLIRRSAVTPSVSGDLPPASVSVDPPKPQGFGRSFGEVIQKTGDAGMTVTISPPGARKERRKASGIAVQAAVVDASVASAAAVAAAAAPAGGGTGLAIEVEAFAEADADGSGSAASAGSTAKKKKKSKKSKQ